MGRVTAVVFDIGETLIDYGNPPNWTALYHSALEAVDRACGLGLAEEDFLSAIEVLKRYNTRLRPRTKEVSADEIFQEILDGWRRPDGPREAVKREFFAFFKRNDPRPYQDVPGTLAELKRAGVRTATLSDVAYGEDNETALADIQEIAAFIDLPLTSRDIGWRKPDGRGLRYIAEQFQEDVRNLIFVGNEEKDVLCAKAAGAVSVLIDREGRRPDYGQAYTVSSMDELQKILQERS
ncbi:MAG: HAD family hydrolase [Oscillospiraceae bacterium]|nr:HAD family hydrolase [Oscillospiraceae bacterium]